MSKLGCAYKSCTNTKYKLPDLTFHRFPTHDEDLKAMLTTFRIFFNQVRFHKYNSTPKQWDKDGVKYGLVTYYPRYPNHKDPPITPTKLLLVERVKPIKGNPEMHKRILTFMGLDKDKKKVERAIVKNIPEVCALLWTIKHLIKVSPIELPDNLPDDDSISTYLHESGKLYVFPKIDEARYQAAVKFNNNPKRLDGDTLQEKLRLKWVQGWHLDP